MATTFVAIWIATLSNLYNVQYAFTLFDRHLSWWAGLHGSVISPVHTSPKNKNAKRILHHFLGCDATNYESGFRVINRPNTVRCSHSPSACRGSLSVHCHKAAKHSSCSKCKMCLSKTDQTYMPWGNLLCIVFPGTRRNDTSGPQAGFK